MTALATREPTQKHAGPPPTDPGPPSALRAESDRWPSTHRVLPWLIAAVTVMVYIVPFDSINFRLGLPFDTQFDRLLLIVVLLAWVAVAVLPSRTSISWRPSPVNLAIFVFVTLCAASLCFNLRDLLWNGEMGLSVKQLLLSFSYLAFFFVASTSLEREEIEPLLKLAVVLATITALGTIYEFRTNTNLFSTVAQHLFRPLGAVVRPAPQALIAGRHHVEGPTGHPLADATLLAMSAPFALAFSVYSTRTRDTVLWALAGVIILSACVTTGEKSGLVIPIPAVIAMALYDRRRFVRFWPLLVVAIGVIIIAAPHAISSLIYQFRVAGTSGSTSERTADYSQVAPYIASHLLVGRGFGSFDPHKYIILDDTMLGLLVQIGALGTIAYAGIIGAAGYVGHRAARASFGLSRGLMAAGVGACVGFFVSNFLYDASSFRQGPYLFFLFAAFIVVYARGRTTPLQISPSAAELPRWMQFLDGPE